MRCGTRATRPTTSACSGRTRATWAGGTRRPTAGTWPTGPRWATSGERGPGWGPWSTGRMVAVGWGYSPGGTTPGGDAVAGMQVPLSGDGATSPGVVQRMLAGGGSSAGGTTPERGCRPWGGVQRRVRPRERFPFKDPIGAAVVVGGGSAGRARPPRRAPAAIVPSPWRPRRPPAPFTCKTPHKSGWAGTGAAWGAPSRPRAGGGWPVRGSNPGGMPRSQPGVSILPRDGMPRSQPGAPTPFPGRDARCWPRWGSRSPADPPGSGRFSPPAGCGCTRARSWWLIPG